MPWGNYRKTPCEQCGNSFWTLAAALGSGTGNVCRSCSRGPSSGGSVVATASAMGPVAGRTSVRDQMVQAQRLHAFQRAAAARQRAAARALHSEMAGSSLSSRMRALQFRDLTPEDYEVLQQLDEAQRQHHADEEGSGSNGSASGLLTSNGSGTALAGRWQSSTNGQRRRTAMRPNALAPAPESGDWQGEDCAICLDCLKDSETVCALPRCGHVFHRTCIEGWLMRGKPTCPLDALEVDL